MKQASKNSLIDSIDECITNAINKGILNLHTQNDYFDGRTIRLNNNDLINFGSCSYLGLEVDERLKQGTINATIKYGTQFSSSRAYIACGLYEELENLLSEIFSAKAIIAQSSSLVHIATIPIAVDDNDAVILDQQVHNSVQNAVQLIKSRGVSVEIIRHNNLEMLEDKIKKLSNSHYRIWYMIDSVYSMYGHFAPLLELYELMEKYPQLHLYIDDSHGMSWAGKNGAGYTLSKVSLHPKMILTTSLAKGFGTGGGVVVSTDNELIRKIRTCGSSFVFSGPIQPPMLGATIESAKIHLSPEINVLQEKLKAKINYFENLLLEKKLPFIPSSGSPIFFLAMGLPNLGFEMVEQLMKNGFYTDISVFPSVPLKRSGVRIPINNNITNIDMENIITIIESNYPTILKKNNQTIHDIEKHFRTEFSYPNLIKKEKGSPLTIKTYSSITEIKLELWDNLLGDRGSFDWQGCKFLEDVFSENDKPENNWVFYYFIITDEKNKTVLATFFSHLLCKDDMLSPASVSEQIEEIRINDPYYLTSKIMMMGSLLTEGDHLYIDRTNPQWQQAIIKLMEQVREIQDKNQSNAIYLRDFDTNDIELRDFFINQGFFRIDLPDSYILNKPKWKTNDEFLSSLNGKYRFHQRKEVIPYEKYYEIKIVKEATDDDFEQWNALYLNIKRNKLKLNTFDLPKKIFKKLLEDENWLILELKLKEEYQKDAINTPLSICFIHKSQKNISPMFLGLDYDYLEQYKPYRQNLFQVIKLGIKLDVDKIHLGMDANLEKSRFGAIPQKRSTYIQSNENYNLESLNIFVVNK